MEVVAMSIGMIDAGFWRDKRVFITGHTGFKGSWLSEWLLDLGAVPMGYSLAPDQTPAHFNILGLQDRMQSHIGDIRSRVELRETLLEFAPEIVLHLAAQPLVRDSYQDPVGTFETNAIGTANMMDAIRVCSSVKAAVMVTTDKVYENPESNLPFTEDQSLGGHDPYSASKACAEIVVASMRRSFPTAARTASARAGNVIGGGDWARDRLIPDTIRCRGNNGKMTIRSPKAVRPWQHVLESLSGYLVLAQRLCASDGASFAESFNFGPEIADCRSVEEVLTLFSKFLPGGFNWEVDKNPQPHEARFLRLDCTKARTRLNWQPRWNLETALQKSAEWYGTYLEVGQSGSTASLRSLTQKQIKDYTAARI